MKRNIIYIGIVLIITLIAIYLYAQSKKIIHDVVIYEPGTTIGSLYPENLSFEEIDRTDPMGTLFSKTCVTDPAQLDAIYDQDTRESKIMHSIYGRGTNTSFKTRFRKKEPLFSLYYEGMYGPPMWFCFFEGKLKSGKKIRTPFRFELQSGSWKQTTDISKYATIDVLFDLAKEHEFFEDNLALTPEIIRDFIARCQEIDEIITERMQTDPDYYSPVQLGR